MLSKILAIDIFFFSKSREEIFPSGRIQYSLEHRKNEDSTIMDWGPTWSSSNEKFKEAMDEINMRIVQRQKMAPIFKKNIENRKQQYLDKQKFIVKFSFFEGLLNYIDTQVTTYTYNCIDKDSIIEFKEQKELEATRMSFNANFYGNYINEDLIVSKQCCGGYTKNSVCMYDFTIKLLDHDYLNFSTRHLGDFD